MNELVALLLDPEGSLVKIGILKTPCWPNQYYGGFIVRSADQLGPQWISLRNDNGFCATEDEALEYCVKAQELHNRYEAECASFRASLDNIQ